MDLFGSGQTNIITKKGRLKGVIKFGFGYGTVFLSFSGALIF